MWMMLQVDEFCDYVIVFGEIYIVCEFCEFVFVCVGMLIIWCGEEFEEVGVDVDGKVCVQIDECFFCFVEVDFLFGDVSLVKVEFGWELEVSFQQFVEMMVDVDVVVLQ